MKNQLAIDGYCKIAGKKDKLKHCRGGLCLIMSMSISEVLLNKA